MKFIIARDVFTIYSHGGYNVHYNINGKISIYYLAAERFLFMNGDTNNNKCDIDVERDLRTLYTVFIIAYRRFSIFEYSTVVYCRAFIKFNLYVNKTVNNAIRIAITITITITTQYSQYTILSTQQRFKNTHTHTHTHTTCSIQKL